MAVRFTRTSSQYLARSANVLNYNADYTWMGWYYLVSDVNGYAGFFCVSYADLASDAFQAGADGTTLNMYCANGTDVDDINGSTLSLQTWYHIAMVRSGANLTVYLNGVSDITGNVSVTDRPAPNGMWTGSWRGTADYLNGRCFALKGWTAALTQAEVQAEMYAIAPRRATNLYGWWPCFPGATERLADYSGNGYNWTASGSAPTDEDPPPVGWGGPVEQLWSPVVYPPVVDLEGYRWRNDNGDEASATWKANQDAGASAAVNELIRLRLLLNASGDPASRQFKLRYKRHNGSHWRDVPVGS